MNRSGRVVSRRRAHRTSQTSVLLQGTRNSTVIGELPEKSGFGSVRIPPVAGWLDLGETGGGRTVQCLVAGGGISQHQTPANGIKVLLSILRFGDFSGFSMKSISAFMRRLSDQYLR